MTLTGTWATNPAGALALTWTTSTAPVRHRHTPHALRISQTSHHD
jgi:hypothetical protein